MTPSARIPWGSKLKNFPWSSGLGLGGHASPVFPVLLGLVKIPLADAQLLESVMVSNMFSLQ